MRTLGIVSMKGGVGKTTLAANLAAAFARAHRDPVAIIELDPQNGLAWHFSGRAAEIPGISDYALEHDDLGNGWLLPSNGIRLYPYGHADESRRLAFESLLMRQPGWLGERIARIQRERPGTIVLIDTPPGHSVYLEQVLACADQLLMLLLPDMASLATVGDMESLLEPVLARRPDLVNHYLINQAEPGQPLGMQMAELLQDRFGPRLLPVRIHRDESVAEALALHRTVNDYDADSQAARDLRRAAELIGELLAT